MRKGEEEIQPTRWELHDAMFSTDNMYKKVREYALARDMKNTGTALRIMKKYHEGQTRKDKDKVPYISHPLMLACHAIALRFKSDYDFECFATKHGIHFRWYREWDYPVLNPPSSGTDADCLAKYMEK